MTEEVLKVDYGFRRELAKKVEGNLVAYCYQCGACVGDCPASTYSDDAFNPREVMLKVLYGLGEEVLDPALLWQCTTCYNCEERCPQEVKPVEVIIALKNILKDRGKMTEAAKRVVETFEKTGRTTPITSAVTRNRDKFGLPPLPEVPVAEIAEILLPAEGEEQ